MKKSCFYSIFLSFFLIPVASAVWGQTTQPVIAYVTIQGNHQGNFKGDGMMQGKQGQIECLGFSYTIQTPTDVSSGSAVGKRQHSPVVIVKRMDGSTPQLLQASYSNEVLKTVTIEFVRAGQTTPYQTIKLTNATIAKLTQYGGTASPDKLIPNNGMLEEISLTFQKIEVDNIESKTSASDNWNAR